MGLDTYARRSNEQDGLLTPEDKQAFEEAGINLCGGLLSGNGNDGSFRGKVYNDWVEAVTGQTLYEEWLEPDTVARMSDYLQMWALGLADWVKDDDRRDVLDLAKFFRICKERHLGLWNWW